MRQRKVKIWKREICQIRRYWYIIQCEIWKMGRAAGRKQRNLYGGYSG